eukprot:7603795-Pyramimonas_sp.AAC.1
MHTLYPSKTEVTSPATSSNTSPCVECGPNARSYSKACCPQAMLRPSSRTCPSQASKPEPER